LYQQKKAAMLLFKGGTALRIVYNSPRYSEDLDFSIANLSNKEIEDIMVAVLYQLEKMNLPTGIKESKETTGGYLADLTVDMQGEPVRIAIQGSRRKIRDTIPNVMVIDNEYIPPYTVFLLHRYELVKEKIQAARTRKKPRDFYDLYFLMRANMIDISYRSLLTDIPAILETEKIDFKQELKIFLPHSHWAIIRDFKKNLLQEMQRFI